MGTAGGGANETVHPPFRGPNGENLEMSKKSLNTRKRTENIIKSIRLPELFNDRGARSEKLGKAGKGWTTNIYRITGAYS